MFYDITQKTQLEWNLTKHVMGDNTSGGKFSGLKPGIYLWFILLQSEVDDHPDFGGSDVAFLQSDGPSDGHGGMSRSPFHKSPHVTESI